jgi:hypothetical protein
VANIEVTPHFTSNGVTCHGPAQTFTITVNPSAKVDDPADKVVCHNSPVAAISFTSTNTGGAMSYSWINNQPGIGLAANGTGPIDPFTATNGGSEPVTATIVVTPHFENAWLTCNGPSQSFTITVNPEAMMNDPADQVVCNGSSVNPINFTTTGPEELPHIHGITTLLP